MIYNSLKQHNHIVAILQQFILILPYDLLGKYKRGDAIPSIEVAKRIADAFGVSLDYLVGEGINSKFDKNTLKRIKEIELLDDDKKRTLLDVIDTFIRESKGKKAFAS